MPVGTTSWETFLRPDRIVAVIVAAVLGGLIIGFAVRLLVKLVTGQRLPGYLQNVFRLLGAIICGWIAAFMPLGGGGFGFGSGEIKLRGQQYEAERFVRGGEIGRERQGDLSFIPRLGIGLFGFVASTQPRGCE